MRVIGSKTWLLSGAFGSSPRQQHTDTTVIEEENGSSIIGAPVPDVPMVNQDGKTIHLSNFKGKTVLVTFIYTRCPFPTFCPLLSSEFASIQRELFKTPELYQKTHLVSISLEPTYDIPPVMRKYGLFYLQRRFSRICRTGISFRRSPRICKHLRRLSASHIMGKII